MQLGSFKCLSSVIFVVYLLREVTSNTVLQSCSFETPCGLSHSSDSQFYWQRVSGATPNQNTGPSNDHTLGNQNGQYVYAPSSQLYSDFGQQSTLYSPQYRLTAGRGRIEFYYHMYDGTQPNDMGSLSVYVCEDSSAVWTRRRDQGNQWRYSGEVDFSCQREFRVYIVASRGKFQSDIAIDDLIITDVFEDPTTPAVITEPPTTTPPTPATTRPSTTRRATPQPPPNTPPPVPPIPPTNPQITAVPAFPSGKPATLAIKTIPTTTTIWTKIPQVSTATSSLDTVDNSTLLAVISSTSSIETEGPTSVVTNNTMAVGISGDPNLQSGSQSPSFVGPIVVVCVAVLFIGSTLCLAVKRKNSTQKPSLKVANKVQCAVVNPSYKGMADSDLDSVANDTTRANYSYKELLQQQSYTSIDETGRESDVDYNTVDGFDAAGDEGYQEIRVKDTPKRRGESVLYAAIPDQDDVTNDEYSHTSANRGGNGGSPIAAAGGRWKRGAIRKMAPSDGDEQEYAAIRDLGTVNE